LADNAPSWFRHRRLPRCRKKAPGFAGFATWLDLTPAHPDLFAIPDASSVIQLPWKKDVAWVAADCVMEDKPVEQAPRVILKKLIAEAAEAGLRVKTGVEPEFFLISPDGSEISDASIPPRSPATTSRR
jgi:glutamine synthetase